MINHKEKHLQIFSKLTEIQARNWIEANYDQNAIGKIKQLKPVNERKIEVEGITEAYFEHYAKFPLPRLLDFLSNYMLADYIKDVSAAKKKEENPFLTDRQAMDRRKREVGMEAEKTDHFNAKRIWNFPQQRVTQEPSLND